MRCPRRFVSGSLRVRSTRRGDRTDEAAITEEQIIGFVREASEPSYYAWKAKFGGMKVSDAQQLKALELENGKLKRLPANSTLEVDSMREGAVPKVVAVAARREAVRQLQGLGMSERKALRLVGMSANTLRHLATMATRVRASA